MDFLSSLVVLNGNAHIAIVTEHIPAHALTSSGNVQVKGHISGGEGSLQVTFKYPQDVQAGEYSCEANGLSNLGHNVMLTTTLEVGVTTPTMDDLIQQIAEMKQKADRQEQKSSQQDRDIAALKQEIASLSHVVESGVIDCSDSSLWNERLTNVYGGRDRFVSKTVQFQRNFTSPPVVHMAMSHIYDQVYGGESSVTNEYFYIDLVAVTKNNFTMRCRTFEPDHILMSVSWVGISQ